MYQYREANILSHLMNLEAIKKVSNIHLPYHRAYKKNAFVNEEGMKQIPDKPNSFKFENFIFDSFAFFDDMLLLRVDENEEFAPIKDFTGIYNPDTAKEKYEKYLEIKQELKNNYGDEKERERKLDLLRYQFNEIEESNLKINEEDNLEEKRKLMLNSEKISKNLNEADIAIGENSIDSINVAIRALEKIENIDKKYEDISSNLKNIYYELQEISRDISEHKEDVYFDEQERNEVEERLDLIYNLKRKYGNDVQEILNYKERDRSGNKSY